MPQLAVAPQPTNTDPPAFDALYRENAADVFAYVMTLLRDRPSAEDVTMAAFERAFRKWKSFDAKRGSERAWLFTIARNAALDELRKRKRTAPLVGEVADDAPAVDETDPLQRAAV